MTNKSAGLLPDREVAEVDGPFFAHRLFGVLLLLLQFKWVNICRPTDTARNHICQEQDMLCRDEEKFVYSEV